jgi:hypothetical protein
MFDAAHARGFPRRELEIAFTAGRYIYIRVLFSLVTLIG